MQHASPVVSAGPRARLDWVDVAKGGAIILVVLYHASLFLAVVGGAGPWEQVSLVLDTFRMPLFFFTAGLFARSAVRGGFRRLVGRRVVPLLWIYLLWSVVYTVVFTLLPPARLPSPTLADLPLILVIPNESTWFVYALALFLVIAWGIERLPAPLRLLPAVVVSVAFGTGAVDLSSSALDKMGTYLVFFLLAVQVGPRLTSRTPRVTALGTTLVALVYAGGAAAAFALEFDRLPFVRLVLGLLAVATGVAVAILLGGTLAGRGLARLGRRTLPVYLLHFYPVIAIAEAYAALSGPGGGAGWLALLLPPATAVVAIVAALAVHRVLGRVESLWTAPRPRRALV